jgi:hypothetical protein
MLGCQLGKWQADMAFFLSKKQINRTIIPSQHKEKE